MDNINYINEFVNDTLINKDFYSIKIIKKDINILIFLNLDIKTNDILVFKLNRNFKEKSYFKFIKGLPDGDFVMSKEMINNLLKIIINKKN